MARVDMPNSLARSAMANKSRLSASSLFNVSSPAPDGLFVILTQILLGELADHGLGQLVPEDDLARHFELGKALLEERLESVRAQRLAFLELDIGHGRLAAIGVLDPDHIGLVDARMLVDRVLDGAWIDVEARADDQSLDPVDKEDITVLV